MAQSKVEVFATQPLKPRPHWRLQSPFLATIADAENDYRYIIDILN